MSSLNDRFGTSLLNRTARQLRASGTTNENRDIQDLIALSAQEGLECATYALPVVEEVVALQRESIALQNSLRENMKEQERHQELKRIQSKVTGLTANISGLARRPLRQALVRLHAVPQESRAQAALAQARQDAGLGRLGPLRFPARFDPRGLIASTKNRVAKRTEALLTQAQKIDLLEELAGRKLSAQQIARGDFESDVILAIAQVHGLSTEGYQQDLDSTLMSRGADLQKAHQDDAHALANVQRQTAEKEATLQTMINGSFTTAEGYQPLSGGFVQEDLKGLPPDKQALYAEALQNAKTSLSLPTASAYCAALSGASAAPPKQEAAAPWQMKVDGSDPHLRQFGVTIDLRILGGRSLNEGTLFAQISDHLLRQENITLLATEHSEKLQDPQSWILKKVKGTDESFNVIVESPALHGAEGVRQANAVMAACQHFGMEVRNEPTLFTGKAAPAMTADSIAALDKMDRVLLEDVVKDAEQRFGKNEILWRGTKLPDPLIINRSKASLPLATPYAHVATIYSGVDYNNQNSNLVKEKTKIMVTNDQGQQVNACRSIGFLNVFERSPSDRPQVNDLLDHHVSMALASGTQLALTPDAKYGLKGAAEDTDTILTQQDKHLGGYLQYNGAFIPLKNIPQDLMATISAETSNIAATSNFRRTQDLSLPASNGIPLSIVPLSRLDSTGQTEVFKSDIERVFTNVITPSRGLALETAQATNLAPTQGLTRGARNLAALRVPQPTTEPAPQEVRSKNSMAFA